MAIDYEIVRDDLNTIFAQAGSDMPRQLKVAWNDYIAQLAAGEI